MQTASDRFFTIEFHTGSECDPAIRRQRAEERLAAAKAAVAGGQFVVERAGTLSLLDPGHFSASFRAMRWMEPQDIAAAKRLPQMAIGESVTLAEGFHPIHGIKRRTVTRVA